MERLLLICIAAVVTCTISATKRESAVIVVSPDDVIGVLGDTVLLPCVALSTLNSTAPVSIMWQRNGVNLDNSSAESIHVLEPVVESNITLEKSVLELCLTELTEGREYSCVAMFQQQVLDQRTFRVIVEALPRSPVQILMAPADMTVNASQTVSFTCMATGQPIPSITWLRDGNPIENSSLHVITEERMNRNEVGTIVVSRLEICPVNGGVYTCKTDNNHSSKDVSFTVNVPVTASNSHAILNATINQNNTISCDFIGYPVPNSLTWTLNGKPADTAAFTTRTVQVMGRTRSYLSFKPYSTQFSGEYTCTANQDGLEAQCTITVIIQVPAEILVAPVRSQTVDSSVTLTCLAYGMPPPMISWKYMGTSVSQEFVVNSTRRLMHGVFVVKSFVELCAEDVKGSVRSGRYSCVADNAVSTAQGASVKSASFDVCYLNPRSFGLMAVGRDIDIAEGGTYYLPCLAYNRNPNNPISISWESGDQSFLHLSNLRIYERKMSRGGINWLQSTLEIYCATDQNEIEYRCIVSNGTEKIQENFSLRFPFTPVFQYPPPSMDTEYVKQENSFISLSCVVSGHPLPNITWFKDGSPLELRDGHVINNVPVEDTAVNSTLSLSVLSEVDSGQYWCKAENVVGETEMNMFFSLNVFPASSTPPTGDLTQRHSRATDYVSYFGSALCILALMAVSLIRLISKHHRSKIETMSILNFCIATSLLYLFYIPSSSGSTSQGVCAFLSSLFHIFFLSASFSISILLFLGLLSAYHRSKLAQGSAILFVWGFALLIMAFSLGAGIQFYMDTETCIPMKWALWFGLIFPVGVVHLITWFLLFTYFLINKKFSKINNNTPSTISPWMREAIPIALILLLFEVAWGTQLAILSTTPTIAVAATLQVVFVLASASIGLVALLYFYFLQRPGDGTSAHPNRDSISISGIDNSGRETSSQEPGTPHSMGSVDTVAVIHIDESDKIYVKQADL